MGKGSSQGLELQVKLKLAGPASWLFPHSLAFLHSGKVLSVGASPAAKEISIY